MPRFEQYRRLESMQPFENLNLGFRAEIHDPVWFLGRQWQMGEHQGEDASSPVEVSYQVEHIPLDPYQNNLRMDPRNYPPEAIIESEAGDWWTPGRRIRLGKAYAATKRMPVGERTEKRFLLDNLPYPYDRFNGLGYDGQKLHAADPTNEVFREVPREQPADLWDPTELAYFGELTAKHTRTLSLDRHAGGRIDWYSVDADGPLPPPAKPPRTRRVLPDRMRYPGSPLPRWWQLEDPNYDIAAFPPDRGHFATLLLIDLIVSHSDDWFTFPVDAEAGSVVKLHQVLVKDSFDETWEVTPPTDWSLFSVTGLSETALLIWPTVATPLNGAVLEEVVLGVDEDANLLWAIETRADGRDLPTVGLEAESIGPEGGESGDSPAEEPGGTLVASARPRYRYQAAEGLRPYWHPYAIENIEGHRRFVQGRLADLSTDPPKLMPEPRVKLLYDLENLAAHPDQQSWPVHQIEPAAIPKHGIRVQRRWMLARRADGVPALWLQRQRMPLAQPPISNARFDIFAPQREYQE